MLFKFHGPLVARLVSEGCEVHLAAHQLVDDPVYAPKLRALGARLHDVSLHRNSLNPARDLATFLAIIRLLRRVRPDRLLSYTVKPVVYGTLAAWLVGVPRRIALIVGLGYAFTGEVRGKRAAIRVVISALYRTALARANVVCFQNRDDANAFRELRIVGARQECHVVDGCGVDLEAFPENPVTPGRHRFLFVGRLLEDKGVRELAEAARILRRSEPSAEVVLLGGSDTNPTGITPEEVQRWVDAGDVEWLGYRDDVRDELVKCSAFVLPSHREGLPQSTVEALATGRAVITTDVPGCRETVEDGINGYLVPASDPASLAAAMQHFVSDPSLAGRMGAASRRLAECRFDVELINAELFRLFVLADTEVRP